MKNDIYRELLINLSSLLSRNNENISNESNFIALIKESLPSVSWVGIYYFDKENKSLYLGPFQGKVACTNIKVGSGVCGRCALYLKSIVVPNVLEYDGHIACDALSKSEIVMPIIYNNNLYGVLDLDSYEFNNFDIEDQENLEKCIDILLSIRKENI